MRFCDLPVMHFQRSCMSIRSIAVFNALFHRKPLLPSSSCNENKTRDLLSILKCNPLALNSKSFVLGRDEQSFGSHQPATCCLLPPQTLLRPQCYSEVLHPQRGFNRESFKDTINSDLHMDTSRKRCTQLCSCLVDTFEEQLGHTSPRLREPR